MLFGLFIGVAASAANVNLLITRGQAIAAWIADRFGYHLSAEGLRLAPLRRTLAWRFSSRDA